MQAKVKLNYLGLIVQGHKIQNDHIGREFTIVYNVTSHKLNSIAHRHVTEVFKTASITKFKEEYATFMGVHNTILIHSDGWKTHIKTSDREGNIYTGIRHWLPIDIKV